VIDLLPQLRMCSLEALNGAHISAQANCGVLRPFRGRGQKQTD
jgi:hypothetical protein